MIEFESDMEIPGDFTGHCKELIFGNEYWYIEGLLHREDGPAVVYKSGVKYWYRHGEKHREDGPCEEHCDGYMVYCLFGAYYDEKEYYEHPLVLKHKMNSILSL